MHSTVPAAVEQRSHARIDARELVLIFFFWIFLALLSAASRLLDPRGFGFRGMSPTGPILMSFIESLVWAAFTPVIFWLSSRVSEARMSWVLRALVLLLAGLAIAIAVYLVLSVVRDDLIEFHRHPRPFRPMLEIMRFRFVPQLLFFIAILGTGFAREYFLRDRERAGHAAQLQAQLAEARLAALRMQINPHFLFNTLHAISALVERDPSGVRRMIARLSELLRHTTDSNASDEVTLRDELDFLRRYIEIMEIRFQGRLKVERDIEPAALDALLPNLILQPIVENALEHGASRATGEGKIEISARRDGDVLRMRVRDNGPGVENANARTGIGLANTRERLAQLYGDRAAVTLSTATDGGAVAELTLPFHTASDR